MEIPRQEARETSSTRAARTKSRASRMPQPLKKARRTSRRKRRVSSSPSVWMGGVPGGRFVKVEGPYLLDQGPPGIGAQGQIVGPLTVARAAPIYTPHLRRPCGDKVGKGAQPYPVQGPALRCPAVQKGLRGLDVHDRIGEQGPASLSHGRPPLAAPGLRRPPAGGAAQTPPPESFAPPG